MNANSHAPTPPPTLAHLRAFCAVVEHGGFAAAAEVLDTSQPAISLHVRALERHYRLTLLRRLPRGVRMTEAGEAVYRQATTMLRALAAMDEEMAALHGLDHGHLAIGGSTTVANYVLPALLGAFKEAYPAVAVALVVENTEVIAGRVAGHTLALAFIEGPVPVAYAPALQVAPLRDDDLVLVTPARGPLARRAPVPLADLATLPFLMREPGSGTRQVLEQALGEAGACVRVHLELGHTEAIKTAVGLGLGVSILSRQAVAHECRTGELRAVQVDGLRLRRAYTAISARHSHLMPAERAFLAVAGVNDHWHAAS
ncbi:MAG: LysR family transcriptional regulator [Chloroflexota bacterium]